MNTLILLTENWINYIHETEYCRVIRTNAVALYLINQTLQSWRSQMVSFKNKQSIKIYSSTLLCMYIQESEDRHSHITLIVDICWLYFCASIIASNVHELSHLFLSVILIFPFCRWEKWRHNEVYSLAQGHKVGAHFLRYDYKEPPGVDTSYENTHRKLLRALTLRKGLLG